MPSPYRDAPRDPGFSINVASPRHLLSLLYRPYALHSFPSQFLLCTLSLACTRISSLPSFRPDPPHRIRNSRRPRSSSRRPRSSSRRLRFFSQAHSMVFETTSPEAHISEDISRFAAKPDSYDRLSAFQISKFFKQHESITKDECNRVAADILKSPVSPTPIQGATSYTVAADSEQVPKVIQFQSLKLNMESVDYTRQS
jgi:hypothetical protein